MNVQQSTQHAEPKGIAAKRVDAEAALAHVDARCPDATLIAHCLVFMAEHQAIERGIVRDVQPLFEKFDAIASDRASDIETTAEGRAYQDAYRPYDVRNQHLVREFGDIMKTSPKSIIGATAKAYVCAYLMSEAGPDSDAWANADGFTPVFDEWFAILATDLVNLTTGGAA